MVFNFGKYVSLPFFLILFLLSSCSNVLVQENSGDIEVSLVVPEDSGRLASQRSVNATIILTHHVEGWIENQQGERLQTVNQDFSGSTVLSFKQVEPETVVRVFVRISDNSGVLYSGKSDFFTVERRGNQVSVELDNRDFPTGDEPVAGEGNSPAAPAFDPSWITVKVKSQGSGEDLMVQKGTGETTSVTHEFYGNGSTVSFSLSDGVPPEVRIDQIYIGSEIARSGPEYDQVAGETEYRVQLSYEGNTKSKWFTFKVKSVKAQ